MNELTEHEIKMKEIREDELKDFIGFLDYCITDFNAAEIEYKDFDDPNKELVNVIEKKYRTITLALKDPNLNSDTSDFKEAQDKLKELIEKRPELAKLKPLSEMSQQEIVSEEALKVNINKMLEEADDKIREFNEEKNKEIKDTEKLEQLKNELFEINTKLDQFKDNISEEEYNRLKGLIESVIKEEKDLTEDDIEKISSIRR